MLEVQERSAARTASPDFLAGGADMGRRMREKDWSQHPLGNPRDWPGPLQAALRIVLASRQPLALWWGADCALFFNDACRPLVEGDPDRALGAPVPASWLEVSTRLSAQETDGIAHYALAPNPVPGEGGNIGGVLCTFVRIPEVERELAERVELLTRMHDLALRLGGIPEPGPSLQAILDTAVEAQKADFGLVWLHDRESGALVVRASRNFGPEALQFFSRVMPGPGGGSAGNAYAQNRRWVIEDVDADPGFEPFRQGAHAAGFRSIHSTPIVTRAGHLLGVISVHFARKPRPTAQDMQIADVCARHAADVIEAFEAKAALVRNEHELRELDRRKNEFLATLAHELRNPLAPLRNGLEVLRLAGNNPAMGEKARSMMERQLVQLVRLVDDLLDMSRVSRGKIELRREEVEISAVLRNALETSQPLIAERGHELVTRIPAEGVLVNGDVTRLSQVFWNLLNNAARYTQPRGRIELEVTPLDGAVEVAVRDNGIGIPPEMRERIFEIFTQVERPVEKSQGGLGIGLSIARRLVEMHGGTIRVASEGDGRGAEFVVRLPTNLPRARRILVVDDDPDAAYTLAVLLENAGNVVRVANDGQAAIDVAAEFGPDVVLLDISMPRLNGYDACQRIRELPSCSGSYLVALTGWALDRDRRRATDAGFDCHLVKPVEPEALMKLVRELPGKEARAPAA
jgi:signal transduction histidine kinase/ActR/RegA family two-component response regulator